DQVAHHAADRTCGGSRKRSPAESFGCGRLGAAQSRLPIGTGCQLSHFHTVFGWAWFGNGVPSHSAVRCMSQNDAVTERRTAPEAGHGLERTIFFSDAVIAIAMTLLALELQVPAAHDGVSLAEDFADKMGHQYTAFLISFAVIAMLWFNH